MRKDETTREILERRVREAQLEIVTSPNSKVHLAVQKYDHAKAELDAHLRQTTGANRA